MESKHIDHTRGQRRDPLLGQVFDRRFRVEARIAAGGFGAIYRATHLKSGHEFALKVLHQNLTNAPDVVERFRREGAALTRLRDPHTITAYELGETDDGTLYIVMELLRGESLYERYRARGPLPWEEVVAIARAVCSSLAEAHALGIIHRDLKPTNIHLEPRGNERDFVKVLDFGIAKILRDSDMDEELTQAGQMIGTLDYMSPEQMVGGLCTPSSDIYTLGIVMYEMIAGCKPYDDANSAAAALAAVLTTTPTRLSARAKVTPDLDLVVMRCLERQHTDRFQSAVELAAALDEILPEVDEVVTRVATWGPGVIPNAAPGVSSFASTLQGVATAIPGPPRRSPKAPAAGAAKPVPAAAKPGPAAAKTEPPISATEPAAPRLDTDPEIEPAIEPATSRTKTVKDMEAAVAKTEPLIPKLTPPRAALPRTSDPKLASALASAPALRKSNPKLASSLAPAPAARKSDPKLGSSLTPTPALVRTSDPKLAPSPAPPAIQSDATLLGPPPPDHTPVVRSWPVPPQPSTPQAHGQNHEAYPASHQLPQPPNAPPGQHPGSVGTVAPYDMAGTVHRDALVRRLVLVIGLAVIAIAAVLIASRL